MVTILLEATFVINPVNTSNEFVDVIIKSLNKKFKS